MSKRFLLLLAALTAASCRQAPREVTFVRVQRETLVSTLTTNGKLEPVEFVVARAAVEGPARRVLLEKGMRVKAGDPLVEIEPAGARVELASAESRLAQARAEMSTLERGLTEAERIEIDNAVSKARLELDAAGREASSLERLLARQAATKQELEAARERIRRIELEIAGLEKKRRAQAPAGPKAAAEARVKEAESAIALTRKRIEDAVVRAPMDGIVYRVAVRAGVFLRPGDEVGEIGQLHVLRALVFVDEPDLGRVARGQAVKITWDAEPGRTWEGKVERLPASIVAMENRQVGEVACLIRNEDARLPPGANVDAEIRVQVSEGALTIPKEALRRKDGADGVLVLNGDRLAWRAVKTAASSIARMEIVEGLRDGDAVALPAETPLAEGESVRARLAGEPAP